MYESIHYFHIHQEPIWVQGEKNKNVRLGMTRLGSAPWNTYFWKHLILKSVNTLFPQECMVFWYWRYFIVDILYI